MHSETLLADLKDVLSTMLRSLQTFGDKTYPVSGVLAVTLSPFASAQGKLREASLRPSSETLRCAQGDSESVGSSPAIVGQRVLTREAP